MIILPAAMTARNWLSTDVGERLGQEPGLSVTIVTPDASDEPTARSAGLSWHPLVRVRGSRLHCKLRLLLGYLLHLAIVFRFNALTGFRGAEQRLMQSWALRSIAIKDGVPASRWFGWPFPRSRRIYGWFLRLYYSSWQRHGSIE